MLEKDLKCSLGKLINGDKKDRYNGEGKFNQNPENKAKNIEGKVNKTDKKFNMWRKKTAQTIQEKKTRKKDEILKINNPEILQIYSQEIKQKSQGNNS